MSTTKEKFKIFFNLVLTKRFAVPIFILFSLFLFLTQAELFVRSDGFYYYHTAKSIIDHGSFVTTEEPEYWDTAAPWARTVFEGRYISVASPGTALLNVPILFISKVMDNVIDLDDTYFLEYNGHTLLEGFFMVLNSYLFFVLALVLVYKILRKLGFSERNSLISISLSIISSYILWYVFIFPIFTHVYEFFFVALLCFVFLKYKENSARRFLLFIGISSGFLFLIRPIFLVIFPIFWLFALYKSSLRKLFLNIFYLGLGSLPFLLIYLIYNFVSYGSFFSSGYSVTGINFDLSSFNGLNVLFSIHRGWLVYSPIFIFSFVGLFFALKINKLISILSFWSIFAGVIIYGFWPSWWGGGSFGSRFFIYTLPFCIIGLAFFFSKIKNLKYRNFIVIIAILFLVYSSSLLLLYRVTGFKSEFYLPTDFFAVQLERVSESSSFEEYLRKNFINMQTGSSIPIILDGRMDYLIRFEREYDKIGISITEPKISKQEFPSVLEVFLVNKKDKKVYLTKLYDIKTGETFDVSCRENCVEVNELVENSLEFSRYSGIILDEEFDLYIENGQNVQLRGEFILWNNWDRYYRLF